MSLFSGRDEYPEQRAIASEKRQCFDVATLLDLFDGDTVAIASLLEAAIASIRGDAGAIVRACIAGDRRAILESAHRLKGTSGTIGDKQLLTVASGIEETAAGPGGVPPAPLLEALRESVDLLAEQIAAFSQAAK